MLIVLAVVVVGMFGIAGTFLTIEAKRAAATRGDGRESAGETRVVERSTSERKIGAQLADARLSN